MLTTCCDQPNIANMKTAEMTPARKVILLFGGHTAVSHLLNVDRPQVHRWEYPRERGGTGGRIPARHHPTLLRLASERGIPLTLADLNPELATALSEGKAA